MRSMPSNYAKPRPERRPIRILAILEAASVTGPAKNLLELCRTVRISGDLAITVAVFERSGGKSDFTLAAEETGVQLFRIPERSALDFAAVARLRETIGAEDPDIVQTHAVKSHFLVYLSRVWKQRRWIAWHHGYTTTNLKMRVYNQFDRVSLRAASRVFTVSEAFRRQLLDRGVAPPRIDVLHNSVSLDWAERVRALDRAAIRTDLGIAPDEQVLLAVGRMSHEKRHVDLLEAYQGLRREGLRVRLILVGDGPERGRLQAAADPYVIFTGQVRDTAPYYAVADLMALPSLTEGSPNVLLESMAARIPVVATRVGGVPEIVSDGESALLVPACDTASLGAAIREVLQNTEKRTRLVEEARAVIEARHTPDARANALIALYRKALSGPSE